ncbi:MAG: Nudix family hydrolase [Candidatus Nitrotoga sp.]|nr:Nudix family hydrolase [Candidatus Nitrotoga sp.]
MGSREISAQLGDRVQPGSQYMNSCVIEVAVGVLLREVNGEADASTVNRTLRGRCTYGSFLLAQRPEGKSYAGFWEFPGGKVEEDETLLHALERELHEELGIKIATAYPWLTRLHIYTHATVKLNFFRITVWQGELHGKENQQLSWQTPSNLTISPVLPANIFVLRALQLPPLYAISNAAELGSEMFMERLQVALENGLKLVQMREPDLSREALRELSLRVVKLAHIYGAQVLINSDIELANEIGADGVHLNGVQLAACNSRPSLTWCAASCHNADELQRANNLGFDFVVLSPVLPTRSHPDATHLGWQSFASMAANSAIPVFALGGLCCDDMEKAWQHGAHGIAMLHQAW